MQSSLYYNSPITPNYGPYNRTKQTDKSKAYEYLSWKRSTIQNKQAQQNSNKIQPKKSNRPIMKKNPDESIDSEQPFYSTWLFWVLLLILIAIAVGIGFGVFKLQEYIEHQMKKNHMITSFSPVPNVGDFMVNAEVQPYGTGSSNIQSGNKVSLTRVFSDTDRTEKTPSKQQNETKNKAQSSQNKTVSINTTQPQPTTVLISPQNTIPSALPQINTLPSPQSYPSSLPLPNLSTPTYPSRYA